MVDMVKLEFGFTCTPEFQQLYNRLNQKQVDRLGVGRNQLDLGEVSLRYFTEGFTVDDNANARNFGSGNYTAEVTKPYFKLNNLYLLHKGLSKKQTGLGSSILAKIFNGELYVHDLHHLCDKPYCVGLSLNLMRLDGLRFSHLVSKPAKHSSSFIAQASELIFSLASSFVGATAESDLLIQYATFVDKEHDKSDREIIQDLQRYTFTVNQKLRMSLESPFSNITVYDKYLLEKIIEDAVLDVDLETVQRVQNLWMQYFGEGNDGLPYRFPITSLNFTTKSGSIQDTETLDLASYYGKDLGCFNFYAGDGMKFSSCCRLVSNIDELRSLFQDTWGGGLNVGSMRVVAINAPYIAHKHIKTGEPLEQLLVETLQAAYDILTVQRTYLRKRIAAGFVPVFKPLNWLNERHFFSTIGVLGLWEAAVALGATSLTNITAEMGAIVECIEKFAHEKSSLKMPINVEFVPAESAAYKLADATNQAFNTNYQLLSNQIVPLDKTILLADRINITGQLMGKFSGGALMHINTNERIGNELIFKKLIEQSVNRGVNHLAVNYIFDMCAQGHGFIGGTCPSCGGVSTDKVTRTVGYYAPVSKWNDKRKEENRFRYDWRLVE